MRLPDWENRLSLFLAENAERPFAWGTWDCALFATAVAAEITGEDKAAAFRERGYTDEAGAMLALREVGQGTLVKTISANYPAREIGFAQRGDIVLVSGSLGVAMGNVALFVGEERLVDSLELTHRDGLVSVPRALWERAWAV